MHTGLEQDFVRKIGHGELRINEWSFLATQDYGDIGITVGAMATACPTAKQHDALNRIARAYKADEGLRRLFGQSLHHGVAGVQVLTPHLPNALRTS